jgi:hypothetical protein
MTNPRATAVPTAERVHEALALAREEQLDEQHEQRRGEQRQLGREREPVEAVGRRGP